jgi:hypothetical protein
LHTYKHLLTSIAGQIWDVILSRYGTTEITQKQVYTHWQHINEDSWRLADNQVESACAILAADEHGLTVKTIPIEPEDGILTMAFALKEAVDVYAHQISEVAMDSTCKSQGQCVINRNLPADPGQTNSAG